MKFSTECKQIVANKGQRGKSYCQRVKL